MKVMVVGTGYVGLVQGVCLAELGNEVICIDIDKEKIKKLKEGVSPIYEPGIEELIKRNLKTGRIVFSNSLKENIDGCEIIFIAVGTPPDEEGRADLKYVKGVAKEIGQNLKKHCIVVNKSTVPIGTGESIKDVIKTYYKGEVDVVSNPEFLKEGSAIDDFMHPDRIIIGDSNGGEAAGKVASLYLVLGAPIQVTNLETAEMIKYASNAYLATQISFINSIARICEKVGGDVAEVSKGMKSDSRIGPKAFLNAGLGYGGSCFPKDVEALVEMAREYEVDFKILEEVDSLNKGQRRRFLSKIKANIGGLKGKTIAVWGAAFKPRTDDIRQAPSITIIRGLLEAEAKVVVYDPVAAENVKKIIPQVEFSDTPILACQGADGLVIVTDWDEFKQLDLIELKKIMKKPLIFDGRNIYQQQRMKDLGFNYYSIGR